MTTNGVRFLGVPENSGTGWKVPVGSVAFDEAEIKSRLLNLEQPCHVVQERSGQGVGVSNEAYGPDSDHASGDCLEALAWVPPLPADRLGDADFRSTYGTRYAYYAGAMANSIATEEMVIALGKQGFLGSFGAGGLVPARVEKAIVKIQEALPQGPYAFNLIYSPSEPAIENQCVDLYLKYGMNYVEAAAYMDLSPFVVRYRVAGLALNGQGQIQIKNRIMAKVSRTEVATKFMEPAPEKIIKQLLEQRLITEDQARLSEKVPMADDITVEADSAGHTDNRPMLALLPSIIALRDEIQEKHGYDQPVRIGAGGGIGTPTAALATFMMGAAYVVTGSINQACVEAGVADLCKERLAEAAMADVTMAPSADMFEMGVKLQVLKRGTLFPMRAQKLYDLYLQCNALEEIPIKEKEKLEKQIFRNSLETVWQNTKTYFAERDPSQLERAANHPKRKMALVFRSYLGLASRWAITGEPGREMDYQIWCGPSMGAFNAWVRNSYLADVKNRKVVDVANHILTGTAYSYRIQSLKTQGAHFPGRYSNYQPQPLCP